MKSNYYSPFKDSTLDEETLFYGVTLPSGMVTFYEVIKHSLNSSLIKESRDEECRIRFGIIKK